MYRFKKYIERVKDAGVVGAGGAGFPTHVKLNNTAEIIIANGIECEPLLKADQKLMETYPEDIVEGLRVSMKITDARRGVICIKKKYQKAVEKLKAAIESSNNKNIELYLAKDYYPAGDEQQLVYEVTGKIVPVGGLPIDVGAIVNNIATLYNIAKAADGMPVVDRFVSITGEVKNPITLRVPIGTSIERLIEFAGGPRQNEGYKIIVGGPVMGKVENDWTAPVVKTTSGLVILPSEHLLIRKKTASTNRDIRLAKSVCCQCNFCTQMCPRNALGLKVEPHKVMRALGYGDIYAIGDINSVFGCCDCGLCTYYACNMDLSPGRLTAAVKDGLLRKGIKPHKEVPNKVSNSREYGKVPVRRFIKRLGLDKYDKDAPMYSGKIEVDRVSIPLNQHIGAAAVAVVKEGDYVQKGDLIGEFEHEKVSANVHSSITGVITTVTADYIEVTRKNQAV